MKRIIAAVDGSDIALRAARFALTLAKQLGARLTLVYAIPPTVLAPSAYGDYRAVVEQEYRQYAEKILSEAAARLEPPPDVAVDTKILHGSPAMAIASVAEAEGVDLVVVGSRGLGAAARVLLGSVSDRLAHICEKPVLIVK